MWLLRWIKATRLVAWLIGLTRRPVIGAVLRFVSRTLKYIRRQVTRRLPWNRTHDRQQQEVLNAFAARAEARPLVSVTPLQGAAATDGAQAAQGPDREAAE